MKLASKTEILFSVKSFAAAMLAVYISMRIGLPRPFWAMMTAYIVSAPFSGPTRSKGMYRAGGTLLGAIVVTFLVPQLANSPELLSLALALEGRAGIHALAGDTDGVDGQEEIAGAVLAPDTLARAWGLGIKPADALQDNDGHGFFGALGDSVVTGPTLTNVNDFRAVLVLDE